MTLSRRLLLAQRAALAALHSALCSALQGLTLTASSCTLAHFLYASQPLTVVLGSFLCCFKLSNSKLQTCCVCRVQFAESVAANLSDEDLDDFCTISGANGNNTVTEALRMFANPDAVVVPRVRNSASVWTALWISHDAGSTNRKLSPGCCTRQLHHGKSERTLLHTCSRSKAVPSHSVTACTAT